jgi:O-succinylhomoserine sulfhydrylase
LAQWLEAHSAVKRVFYPGLSSHPQHELAARQQSAFGGIVTCELDGGRDEAFAFIDATQWLSITANFGDAKSTITHPASTTHGRLKPEERQRAGIGEGLIRVSAGLENIDDIITEMKRGLQAVESQCRWRPPRCRTISARRLKQIITDPCACSRQGCCRYDGGCFRRTGRRA